ncbi:MAG: 5-formyltetrahydrofolate cyclo-ligase [Candidatus Marinimicrobia bacterium]|nr:5-formyltetrahydrofolate cyclo-ligase [Candidatus Neomarinimicrobiota bacterium]MCF7828499.1 5-formyltetrahydrofolate cyclo-ligase [Candidatus Neomarinimicrobiota bacterium]MCF7881989.1 5-formyltetrahydrofolate cyclo-ligase [Candidatus Neomarinimicrobiota bacterium]
MNTTTEQTFSSKDAARQHVWDTLENEKAARFPFPPHDRIPNFAGAKEAAQRLMNSPAMEDIESIKINPDAPQRYVREMALRRGITVYMPTPRLRAGFKRFDPNAIPEDKYSEAASLSKGEQYAESISLERLPQMDLIVAGSVAVTADGKRCGKGHGYSDLEYAILLELGHKPVPVVTTVHPIQIAEDFPTEAHDIPLSLLVTPEEIIEVPNPPGAPARLEWSSLTEQDLEEMPVLRELKDQAYNG